MSIKGIKGVKGIKETAADLIEQGRAKLDADGDGKVEAQEVIDALADRAKQTIDAAGEAAEEVKKGFDADGDGTVSAEEVKAVADGAAAKAKETIDGLLGNK